MDFFIPGIPVPQGRPRFARKGKFVSVYTDQKTRTWREYVTVMAREHRPEFPLEGALTITLKFKMPRPKSLPKKVIHHIKRPDLDNLAKAVIDSLGDAKVFKKDSQFAAKKMSKVYSCNPGVHIEILKYE